MKDGSKKNVSKKWILCAIVILFAVLAFLLFWLIRDYRSLRRAQVISARQTLLAAIMRDHGHLSVNDVPQVRSWMTFDYLNTLFGMPPGYLKVQLGVTDPRYPRLSLSSYAKSQHISSETITIEAEAALRAYFANATSTSATSSHI